MGFEDNKGNILTIGEVKPSGDWALSCYDHKSLYSKKPTATEIMSIKGTRALCGILEANDGNIWFGYERSVSFMMERPSRTLKVKWVRNNVFSRQF